MKIKYRFGLAQFIWVVSFLLSLPLVAIASDFASNSAPGAIGLDAVTKPGGNDEDHITDLNLQAYALLKQGNPKAAEEVFKQASTEMDIKKQISAALRVAVINGLGLSEFQQRKYADAEEAYLTAKKIIDDTHLDDDYVRALVDNNLGQAYRNQGKFELAERSYKDVLKLKEEKAIQHLEFIAGAKCNLGLLYYEEKRYQEAEPLFADGMSALLKIVGASSPNYTNLIPYYKVVLRANGHKSSIPGID